jgi:hypothetical protein
MRPLPLHSDHFLAGNVLLYQEYQRRWKAVRDLGNVYIRLHQASGWFMQHHVKDSYKKQEYWLEYLTALNMAQFRADIASHVLESHKKHPELQATATAPRYLDKIAYSWDGMQGMFEMNGEIVPPHTATGNKVTITSSWALINLLFRWANDENNTSNNNKGQAVVGAWQKKTYRLIF